MLGRRPMSSKYLSLLGSSRLDQSCGEKRAQAVVKGRISINWKLFIVFVFKHFGFAIVCGMR